MVKRSIVWDDEAKAARRALYHYIKQDSQQNAVHVRTQFIKTIGGIQYTLHNTLLMPKK